MREHKYKAYHKEQELLADVTAIDFTAKCVTVSAGKEFPHIGVVWKFEDIELMEYTGLKDKNGVEIYEGDIVKFGDNVTHEGVLVVCEWLDWKLMYAYRFITGENKDKFTDMLDTWRTYEVIGNIYQDKHLLEG